MKLIIEIPEKVYKTAQKTNIIQSNADMLEKTIINGIPIPDNATNGDVMKIIFPKIGVYDEWYDEPYQKEDKNE